MKLNKQEIEILDSIREKILNSGLGGITIDDLKDEIFPDDEMIIKQKKTVNYIQIMEELEMVVIQESLHSGYIYHANGKLRMNSFSNLVAEFNKEEDRKRIDLEKTEREIKLLDFQLGDYNRTKSIAKWSFIISIISTIIAIVAIIVSKI
ncbi:hypothetical protein OZ664_05405 [Elizabethkingia sp. HX WHF]|uniref:hypothetical protein n=1 Tax=Elizabethkingia sp. HX WHF TaxID=3003190 RepID=UPI002A247917|nr:hypothetical protein [Elizabethkingia sp. HX WHF]MDX8563431.1 hypothetical protein [Elizabethkingia sp. HX WHF]